MIDQVYQVETLIAIVKIRVTECVQERNIFICNLTGFPAENLYSIVLHGINKL